MNILKKHKKLGLVFCLVLAVLGTMFSGHKALAATTQDQAFAGCVENVINVVQKGNTGDTATQCKLDDPNGNANLIYATNHVQRIENGNFKASSSTVSASSNGVTITVPQSIELLDSNNNSLVYTSSSQAIAYATVNYTATANTSSVYSDAHIYEIYYPLGGDKTFAFLTQIDTNGNFRVLAMVNTHMQSGTPDFVYAATINKVAEGSNSTGAPTGTPANGSCATATSTGSASCSGGSSQGSNACSFGTNISNWSPDFSWILCPLVAGLSTTANGINDVVSSQLNFDTSANLTTSIQRAWAVFKDLVSAMIVILMLVMVLSQAVSWGPFDAYTIKKLLPKLVVAIILMQLSWYICYWLIGLANDAGQGIGQLMAAAFGGMSNLSLPSLLNRWNTAGAAIIGLSAYPTAIAAIVFGGSLLAWGWPTLVLGAIMLVIAVIVAMATLLFRNAFIVILVMTSPFAFLAWVLPGTQKYWKMWKDNFTKLLLFFPMVMALIYGGRIFAWVSAGLGTSGPLDLIMLLVGFFGPYFYLPKTFKWGGSFLDAASKAINESAPIKKGREVAKRELQATQQRKINARADALDPSAQDYARVTKRWHRIPVKWNGSLRKTAIQNLAAGRVLPTKRALATSLQRGKKYSGEENDIADAYLDKWVRRHLEKGIEEWEAKEWNERFKEQFGYDPGFEAMPAGVPAGKMSARALGMLARTNKNIEEYDRLDKAVMRYLPRTNSTLEMGDPKFTFPQIKLDATTGKPMTDKKGRPIYEMVPAWADRVMVGQAFKDPETYGKLAGLRGDWGVHNTPEGGASYGKVYRKAGVAITPRGKKTGFKPGDAIDKEYKKVFVDKDGKPVDRKLLAHYLQAIDEDTLGNIHSGGNTMLTFINEATNWARGVDDQGRDLTYGEGKTALPAKELTRQIIEESLTTTGRSHITNLKSSPAQTKAVNDMLKASGYTHFLDAVGNVHELDVEEIFSASEEAERIKNARSNRGLKVPEPDHHRMLMTEAEAEEYRRTHRPIGPTDDGPAPVPPDEHPEPDGPTEHHYSDSPRPTPTSGPPRVSDVPGHEDVLPPEGEPLHHAGAVPVSPRGADPTVLAINHSGVAPVINVANAADIGAEVGAAVAGQASQIGSAIANQINPAPNGELDAGLIDAIPSLEQGSSSKSSSSPTVVAASGQAGATSAAVGDHPAAVPHAAPPDTAAIGEAAGASFAEHMRRILPETVLKVEHEGGSPEAVRPVAGTDINRPNEPGQQG